MTGVNVDAVVLQVASIAYGRAIYVEAPRYFDITALGVMVNFVCAVRLAGVGNLVGLRYARYASFAWGVIVATGLWQERSLGKARGVIAALDFLGSTDHPVPERVAILAGGDSAMDAARAVQSRGAKEIFIIFGGPRSEMHWHMPESWFATPGMHAMMSVQLRHSELQTGAVLPVSLVIEALELQAADYVRAALAAEGGRIYTAGALVNGGASVSHCVAEGIAIADTIHHDISA